MEDPYSLLGVERGATADEIKSAYRKLARKLHPDVNPGDKRAEERFKRISAAYDLLSDPKQRARFDAGEIDASGAERQPRRNARAAAEAGGFGGFGGSAADIMAEMLRRRGRGQQSWHFGGFGDEAEPLRGGDAQYALRLSLAEAVLGAGKRITLPGGKSLNVKVPAGTADGTVLRLKGQGGPGRNGGAPGDALIEIRVDPHPVLSRDGDDLTMTLAVTLPEAVLGAKITVPTIDGNVALSIPAGSNNGAVLRLKGKGVPVGGGRGDQLVTLKVVLPDRPDAELQAFLRKWGTTHPYKARD